MLLGKSPHPLPQHGHGGPTARLGASLVPGEAHVGTKSSWVMGHSSSQAAAFGDLGGDESHPKDAAQKAVGTATSSRRCRVWSWRRQLRDISCWYGIRASWGSCQQSIARGSLCSPGSWVVPECNANAGNMEPLRSPGLLHECSARLQGSCCTDTKGCPV